MLLKTLQGEFEHEAANTRKLLAAVPADKTGFKVTDFGWTLGELAQHIATIYAWYEGTFKLERFNMDEFNLERPDPADIAATRALFERNVELARNALNGIKEEDLFNEWTMTAGGQVVLGPMPRLQVARGFLFNHIYHHRGELIVYLRAAGAKVPGMYGPTYEDGLKQRAASAE